MTTVRTWHAGLAAWLILLIAPACSQTEYVNGNNQAHLDLARIVRSDLNDIYRDVAPDCAVVLPAVHHAERSFAPADFSAYIERTAARHLAQRLTTVIGPDARDYHARRLALDLTHPGDRQRFLRLTSCEAFLQIDVFSVSAAYLVIWSSTSVDLRLQLWKPNGGGQGEERSLLWLARHAASDGSGGLPLDPLSAAISVFKAGNQKLDGEVSHALVETAIRRMMLTLPDIRNFRAMPARVRATTQLYTVRGDTVSKTRGSGDD